MRDIPFGKPIIMEEEKKAVLEVLSGTTLVHGPRAKAFEQEFAAFTGALYAVSVSSCTAAIHLSYFNLGIGRGDEVIVPAETHVATAHGVELCGARPIFVDAELKTGNIDIDQIESKITPNTKAISVVHFLGMPVNMERILQIARQRNLFVLEDCALGIGSYFKGRHVGLYGDVGCFSFYPVKHMTTAEGGMLITKNEQIFLKISRQKAFGVDRHAGERSIPGVYDVDLLGFNYRMNEIQAALGSAQLKRVPGFLARRRENYDVLDEGLKDIEEIELFQSSYGDYQSSYYCLTILLKQEFIEKRFEVVEQLKQNGVGTSVYYPRPVPLMSYYRQKYGHRREEFPVASQISESSITLPVGPHLDEDDMKYMVQQVKIAIRKVK